MDKNESKSSKKKIACSINFYDLVLDYQKQFKEKYKVKPSLEEITDIIATKISNVGGLKV